jgi:dTDP-4-dehydrorhamnose reductase
LTDGPILIVGGSGQLARSLETLADNRTILRVGRPAFDFDAMDDIPAALATIAPRLVINAAAYTAVDKAESEPEAADRANHLGPALLARYCETAGIALIHVSTDYVFDGTKGAPYLETDAPNPTGIYGATKLAGEQAVLAACRRSVVLRTSWVYAATGKNFVLTMLGAAKRFPKLRVVADQTGCPTNADDLAAAIWAIADTVLADQFRPEYNGVFHATGTGETSWHGFASAIFAEAAAYGLAAPDVEAITTADWPTPARRPADSRLNCDALEQVFGLRLPDWQPSLAATIKRIYESEPKGW